MKRYLGLLLVRLLLAASFRAVEAEEGTVLYVAPVEREMVPCRRL